MIRILEDVELQKVSLKDVSFIYKTIDNEREYLREWLPFVDNTISENDIFEYIQSVIEKQELQFSIYNKNILVGLIGFKDIDKINRRAEIGYWLSQKAQGKGIMTHSVKALLDLGFNDLNLNRIQIKVAIGNIPSKKIPEKLNFRQEGIERDGELLVNGKFTDLIIYSLLKKEFDK